MVKPVNTMNILRRHVPYTPPSGLALLLLQGCSNPR